MQSSAAALPFEYHFFIKTGCSNAELFYFYLIMPNSDYLRKENNRKQRHGKLDVLQRGFEVHRWLRGILLGALVGTGGALLALSTAGATFERNIGLPWLFYLRGAIVPPSQVAIVAIDAQTGGRLGLPAAPMEWPRSIHAHLVDSLTREGASVIVFDMLFAKPKLERDDLRFAAAIAQSDRVVLVEKLTGKEQPIIDDAGQRKGTVWVEELIPPLPSLQKSARGLAAFPLPKLTAAVHEFWAFKDNGGEVPLIPAVALQIETLSLYPQWLQLLERLTVPGLNLLPPSAAEIKRPADVRRLMQTMRHMFEQNSDLSARVTALIDGEMGRSMSEPTARLLKSLARLYASESHRYINFYGPAGTIPNIPFHSVVTDRDLKGSKRAFDFAGKTVFVGFSDLFDPGQPDRFYTVFTRPDGVDLSGVEVAATAYANLLTDRTLKPLGTWETFVTLLMLGSALATMAYLLPALLGVPLALGLATLYAITAQWAFNISDVWMPLATPLVAQLPSALFIGLLGQYLLERRRERHMSEAIGYYLPENIAKDLTKMRLEPGVANKVVYSTCLATDMAGFSGLAQQLDPGALAAFLNEYFDTIAQPLKRHHVSVTEFRADAMMCAWTASEPKADVRRAAILAALEVVEAITAFQRRQQNLRARIGLEAGWVYVGHAGGGGHFVYSVVGDCANTASRIEGLNKYLGTQLLASDAVVEGIEGILQRPLGKFQVVGRAGALSIVEILAKQEDASSDHLVLCERFAEALNLFNKAQWRAAGLSFASILDGYPQDGPARFYFSLCERYQGGTLPPEEDPSVIVMEAK